MSTTVVTPDQFAQLAARVAALDGLGPQNPSLSFVNKTAMRLNGWDKRVSSLALTLQAALDNLTAAVRQCVGLVQNLTGTTGINVPVPSQTTLVPPSVKK